MKEFTADERIIARSIDKKYKWVARDRLGNLFVFNQKPHKSFGGVWVCKSMKWNDMFALNEMFKSITWDDAAPTLIKDIYDPQILDDAEKKYLTAVLKPLPKVKHIVKSTTSYRKKSEFIGVCFETGEVMVFPYFEEQTMYKGMKADKAYTLEELGLDP